MRFGRRLQRTGYADAAGGGVRGERIRDSSSPPAGQPVEGPDAGQDGRSPKRAWSAVCPSIPMAAPVRERVCGIYTTSRLGRHPSRKRPRWSARRSPVWNRAGRSISLTDRDKRSASGRTAPGRAWIFPRPCSTVTGSRDRLVVSMWQRNMLYNGSAAYGGSPVRPTFLAGRPAFRARGICCKAGEAARAPSAARRVSRGSRFCILKKGYDLVYATDAAGPGGRVRSTSAGPRTCRVCAPYSRVGCRGGEPKDGAR